MHTRFLLSFALCSVAVIVSGCDMLRNHIQEAASEQQPTVVIGEGYRIEVDGQAVAIFGFDPCPVQERATIKVVPEDNLCIVLDKTKTKVAVQLAYPSGPVTEEWTIVRTSATANQAQGTFLQRPNGDFVVSAQ